MESLWKLQSNTFGFRRELLKIDFRNTFGVKVINFIGKTSQQYNWGNISVS